MLCEDQIETIEHLLFKCRVAQGFLFQVKKWLGWGAVSNSLTSLTRWLERAKMSKSKKKIYAAYMAALVYLIWKSRNWKDFVDMIVV